MAALVFLLDKHQLSAAHPHHPAAFAALPQPSFRRTRRRAPLALSASSPLRRHLESTRAAEWRGRHIACVPSIRARRKALTVRPSAAREDVAVAAAPETDQLPASTTSDKQPPHGPAKMGHLVKANEYQLQPPLGPPHVQTPSGTPESSAVGGVADRSPAGGEGEGEGEGGSGQLFASASGREAEKKRKAAAAAGGGSESAFGVESVDIFQAFAEWLEQAYTAIVETFFPPSPLAPYESSIQLGEGPGGRGLKRPSLTEAVPGTGIALSLLTFILAFFPGTSPQFIAALTPATSAIVAAAAATAETQSREAVARAKKFSASAAVAAARADAASARAAAASSAVPAASAWAGFGAVLAGALEVGAVVPGLVTLGRFSAVIATAMAAWAAILAATAEAEAKIAMAQTPEEEETSTQATNEQTAKALFFVLGPALCALVAARGRSKLAVSAAVAAATAAQAAARAERYAAQAARATAAKAIRASRSEVEVSKAEASAAVAPFASASAAVAPPAAVVIAVLDPIWSVLAPLMATFFGFIAVEAATKTKEEADEAQAIALESVFSPTYQSLKPVTSLRASVLQLFGWLGRCVTRFNASVWRSVRAPFQWRAVWRAKFRQWAVLDLAGRRRDARAAAKEEPKGPDERDDKRRSDESPTPPVEPPERPRERIASDAAEGDHGPAMRINEYRGQETEAIMADARVPFPRDRRRQSDQQQPPPPETVTQQQQERRRATLTQPAVGATEGPSRPQRGWKFPSWPRFLRPPPADAPSPVRRRTAIPDRVDWSVVDLALESGEASNEALKSLVREIEFPPRGRSAGMTTGGVVKTPTPKGRVAAANDTAVATTTATGGGSLPHEGAADGGASSPLSLTYDGKKLSVKGRVDGAGPASEAVKGETAAVEERKREAIEAK
ncbi:unnamed protein product [Vitrella brassicaformis CCMP3155]|uniref:Uncharacterized protein n=3 Tax=Vitrella brassicaformis TaxID=1169539 RepID=A0A0G4G6S7_VITBC|nr:unnamed protein product [Vitrella brassicaformis CCMP3155]|eukprot:CEM24417.1 unnamed protein product [Vitrella brassicaformis CCMP3155]